MSDPSICIHCGSYWLAGHADDCAQDVFDFGTLE